jgi:DNA-binding CsgD family transcriptional regulator
LRAVTGTDARRQRRATLGIAALFGAVALLAAFDLISDLREGTTGTHVAIEGAVVALGAIGAGWMVGRVRALAREAQALRVQARALAERLEAAGREAARWRAETGDLVAGLAQAIDRQLAAWGLTAAEKDIALLLLKGLSHKEIAALRGVGETTVRQQARAIYRKASLGGRHDLAAFFLEDLLAPRPARS